METDKIRLVVELERDLHRKFKVKTAQEGTSMSKVLTACAKHYTDSPPDRITEEKADTKPGK